MEVEEVKSYTIQRVDFIGEFYTYERHGPESWFRRIGEDAVSSGISKEETAKMEEAYQRWLHGI